MNEADIWRFSILAVWGLRAIHEKKIIHRDIKSENLLLQSIDTQIKICDMNVSAQGSIIGAASGQFGTPYFTAPEVWNNKVYTQKCDIWSLGCVVFHMAAQKTPFEGLNYSQLWAKMKAQEKREGQRMFHPIPSVYSEDLMKFVDLLLSFKPERRPSCNQILKMNMIRK